MKRNIILFLIILILSVLVFFYSKSVVREYSGNFMCHDEICVITIYSKNNQKQTIKELKKVLQDKLQKLTSEINSLNKKSGTVQISEELYNIFEVINKTESYVNDKTLTDAWKKSLKTNKTPSISSLKETPVYINDFKLENGNVTSKVYDINIDSFIYGYLIKEARTYLKNKNIDSYMLNFGGQISVGKHYKNEFNTAILNPVSNKVIDIVKGNNLNIFSVGNKVVSVDGMVYTPVIDPNTKYPYNYHQSITVVCDDPILGNIISYKLFTMDYENGKEFIKNFDIKNVLWLEQNDEIKLLYRH